MGVGFARESRDRMRRPAAFDRYEIAGFAVILASVAVVVGLLLFTS
jgi:hypothetical protein